jgi:hypothetical protein
LKVDVHFFLLPAFYVICITLDSRFCGTLFFLGRVLVSTGFAEGVVASRGGLASLKSPNALTGNNVLSFGRNADLALAA